MSIIFNAFRSPINGCNFVPGCTRFGGLVRMSKVDSLASLGPFLSLNDNFKNVTYISNVPEECKKEPCMLGVDEAGRGPVLGPMVYGIAFCPIKKANILEDLGCADSKQLTEEKREIIFEDINQKDFAKDYLGWAVEVISPNTISNCMNRRSKFSLNEVSMDSAIGLIHKAIDAGVQIEEVYVDTVGPPEKYQAKLSAIFPHFKITVAKKADSTYPIVSAASICAKVTRDHALKMWMFPEGLELNPEQFGSGYPNDPVTKSFLAENIDPVFGYPRLVRFSWSTAETALLGKAYNVQFDDPDSQKPTYAGPKIQKFFKTKDKDGNPPIRERHSFFKDRHLSNVKKLL